ncbi:MAG: hypothetical protein IPL98_04440 [Saprospiraceae bacterium]|nr:hypothetical protein [Saprospiraceae bacterium]
MYNLFYITFLAFCFTSLSVDAQLKQVKFKEYTPKWTYINYDPTAAVKGVTNGYSHLFMHSCAPVTDGEYLYTLSVNAEEFFQGGLLEKVSIKDGKLVWARSFDLRNSKSREFPINLFIDENKNIRIYSYREIPNRTMYFWSKSNASTYVFDQDGNLLKHAYTEDSDSTKFPIINHFFNSIPLYSYNNENSIQYIKKSQSVGNSFQCTNYILSLEGQKIESRSFSIPYQYYYRADNSMTLLNENRFVNLIHSANKKQFADSIQLVLQLFDRKLNHIKSIDILPTIGISDFYGVVDANQDRILISSPKDYFTIFPSTRVPASLVYSIIDTHGNLIEKVTYQTNQYTEVKCVLLKNENACLLFVSERTDEGIKSFYILKSDGKGTFKLLKTLTLENPNQFMSVQFVSQFENSDILISTSISDPDSSSIYVNNNFLSHILLSGKDLGLTVKNNEYSSKDKISISPNPATTSISIKSDDEFSNSVIEYISSEGHILYKDTKTIHIGQNQMDCAFLAPGVYHIRITNQVGKLIHQSNFVKI